VIEPCLKDWTFLMAIGSPFRNVLCVDRLDIERAWKESRNAKKIDLTTLTVFIPCNFEAVQINPALRAQPPRNSVG
jgi:hypothetical protein